MGIFGFGGSSAPSSAPAAPASGTAPTASNQPAPGTSAAPGTTDAGIPGQTAGQPATPASPMDKFSTLWQTTKTDEAAGGNKNYVSMDPAKLAEATGKLNFTAGVKPELLQAVFSGGDQAVNALQQVINSSTQQAFQTAMIGASRLVEQALQSHRQDLLGEIPGMFKNQMLTSQVFEENPALSHPSVRPLIEVLQTQFAAKFPEASNAELRKMAADYLTQTASLVSGKAGQDSGQPLGNANQYGQQAMGQQPDWDNFFSTSL